MFRNIRHLFRKFARPAGNAFKITVAGEPAGSSDKMLAIEHALASLTTHVSSIDQAAVKLELTQAGCNADMHDLRNRHNALAGGVAVISDAIKRTDALFSEYDAATGRFLNSTMRQRDDDLPKTFPTAQPNSPANLPALPLE